MFSLVLSIYFRVTGSLVLNLNNTILNGVRRLGIIELVRVAIDLRIYNRIELVLKSIIMNINKEPASE